MEPLVLAYVFPIDLGRPHCKIKVLFGKSQRGAAARQQKEVRSGDVYTYPVTNEGAEKTCCDSYQLDDENEGEKRKTPAWIDN